MFFAIYINSIVYDGTDKINFMYVVSPPMSGLPFLTEKYGWFVYIMHYACLVLFCVTICYIKPIITAIKEKVNNKKLAAATADKPTTPQTADAPTLKSGEEKKKRRNNRRYRRPKKTEKPDGQPKGE